MHSLKILNSDQKTFTSIANFIKFIWYFWSDLLYDSLFTCFSPYLPCFHTIIYLIEILLHLCFLYYPFGIIWCTWGCSSWMWTEIWDDVWNPLSDVISDSVFASQKTLRKLYLAKTEFDLRKTESEMTSLRGFQTSSQISVHIQLLQPRYSIESRNCNNTSNLSINGFKL